MQLDDPCRRDVSTRLRKVQGQVAGIISMIEEGRDCADIVTQVAAASKALDRAGMRIVVDGIQQSVDAKQRGEANAVDMAKLERLFLSLS